MKELLEWFNELHINYAETFFCMEATGLYCFTLTRFLATYSIDTWIEHAVQIKK